MDLKQLAEMLYPGIDHAVEDYEKIYPPRDLPENAYVTRIAPSPTGFMHLGNLFGAMADERLAHRSGGVFYLRIEDTDQKREVESGVETIINSFSSFGLPFDEGAVLGGETGNYGPYYQRKRAGIYQAVAKSLIEKGLAYPCFCSENDLELMRASQEEKKENFGYYGKWAVCRSLSFEDIRSKIEKGTPFVLRFKSQGSLENKIEHHDLVKGQMLLTENDQDMVLLKSDGIPTYHFAHVVDDHFMRTTHVVRGEEWLATLPFHLQLFDTLGWKRPFYAHTAQLMKMEGGSKRKLSKRKDPELALNFYHEQGYPVESVKEYLMILLNSNYEEWRLQNPLSPMEEFPFSTGKMSVSGSLFDIDKLKDVSRNTLSLMSARKVYDLVLAWSEKYDETLYKMLAKDKEYAISILQIGREGLKPRKDITLWSDVRDYISFFYDEHFTRRDAFPENITKEDVRSILKEYAGNYNETDDQTVWFDKIKALSAEMGFAPETKLYKKNPQDYKGHVGDVSMVLRIAVSGKTSSPDMYQIMKILGKDRVIGRLTEALNSI